MDTNKPVSHVENYPDKLTLSQIELLAGDGDAPGAHRHLSLRSWIVTNTLSPDRLPSSMQHPSIGYLLAILLPLLAISLSMLLVQIAPAFRFIAAPLFLVVLLVSLAWGAAPGVVATLFGVALLVVEVRLFSSALSVITPDAIGILFSLILGLTISLLSGRLQGELLLRKRREVLFQQVVREAQSYARDQKAIFEAIADPVFIIHPESGVDQMNRAARELLAVSESLHTKAEPLFELYDVQGQQLSREQWPQSKMFAGETLYGAAAVDVVLRTWDGRTLDLSVTGAPLYTKEGAVSAAILVCRDVTERRRLEHLLRQAEHLAAERAGQLEAVFEAITDGVFILDAHGHAPRLNQAARSLLDLPDAVVLSAQDTPPFELLDDNGHPLAYELWPEMRLQRGEQLHGEDVVLRTRTGRIRALSVTGAPLWDSDGVVNGGVLVCRDVTERRRLEQQTQESLHALLVLAEALVSLPVGMQRNNATQDMVVTFETVSTRLAELIRSVLHCKRIGIATLDPLTQAVRSMAFVGLSTEQEQQIRQQRPGFLLREIIAGTTINAQLQDGASVMIDMRQSPFVGRANPYGITTMLLVPMRLHDHMLGTMALDHGGEAHLYNERELALARAVADLAALILERERLLEERAESQASLLALEEANHLKDEFIGIAGHELRTPLTTIRASVQLAGRQITRLLKLDAPSSDDIVKALKNMQQLLNRAERQVGMQNRLVNDLLDVSRVETGQLELHPVLYDLPLLVREVVEDQQTLTPERQLAFVLQVAEELLVLVDVDRVRQVVTNYLTNALKYSEIEKPVTVRVSATGSLARVEVIDEGPGLSSMQQQRIWERFYRVPGIDVRSGSGVGLGLGLHISRTIVERHGGNVGVQSTSGHGSTFWFDIPRAEIQS